MALPQLTDEQRKAALEKAAAARHERAELREKIKKGETSLEDVLDSDDPIAARMKVSALIESLPGYGKAKATKVAQISADAYAHTIYPTHTTNDGDAIFVMATGEVEAGVDTIGILATQALEGAIADGVRSARGAFGLKAACDLP